jgi:hypothetical protein
MYRRILLFLILISVIAPACLASPLDITARHGETWIVWNWTIPSTFVDNATDLVVKVDGVPVHDMGLDSNVTIPTTYYLTGVNSNEQHIIRIDICNDTSVFITDSDVETTNQGSTYNYVIFIITILLMIIAIVLRSKIIAVILLSVSLSISLFMSMMMSIENSSFSTVNIILGVVCGFLIVYTLYELWVKHSTWESD